MERDIQKAVVDHAKARGFRPFKRTMFSGYGKSGDPDYEFNGLNEWVFFIEFKRPGERPTEKQQRAIDELTKLGFQVYVVDDVGMGKTCVDVEYAAMLRSSPEVDNHIRDGKLYVGD